MVNLGLFSGNKPVKSAIVSFRIPYYTQWGQSLLVCGSEPVLGSWNVKNGLLLSPFHQGDELIWCGRIPVPAGFGCEYSYYVVDNERNVLRWESGKKRKMLLPDGVQDGGLMELHDLWQLTWMFCYDKLFLEYDKHPMFRSCDVLSSLFTFFSSSSWRP
ncbi:unnamed protein product [Ilex paraguariensis]|uniref:CBM20 domain-containing protein n=1 Tax=Ilex paraguariensis TaxID=185542 RepID=A0ABC8TLT0_9AQUA